MTPKVLGIITVFTWLGKVEKQRDHSKLLNNVLLCVKNFDAERFWSNETVQRAMIKDDNDEVLTKFPRLNELKKTIPKHNDDIRNFTWGKITSNSDYGNFIDKMFYNKDLILYAQRDVMSEWFQEIEEYNLEDTNRAFDWDHICPSSYIHSKKNINQALKDWYHSNGNYRAWKYSLNRIDQDDAPSVKLNPANEGHLKWWSDRLKRNYLTVKQLRDDLLKLSFCDKEWLNMNSDIKKNIRENKTAKDVISCILNRNIYICKEWYDNLEISELIPEIPKNRDDIKEFFENIIYKDKWIGEKENDDRYGYSLPIGENLYVYFSFNVEGDTLKDNEIIFCIYEKNSNETLQKIKISQDKEDKYDQTTYEKAIVGYFTLMTYSEKSIIDIFDKFNLWLNGFPDKKIRDSAVTKFKDSIKSEYRDKIWNRARESDN